MDLGIKNRVAIVGGSSRGFGFAVAETLVGEGADVVICGRDPGVLAEAEKRLVGTGDGRVLAVQADLGRSDDIERLFESTMDKFGRVDIVVNNSGGPPPGHFLQFDDEAWLGAFRGTFLQALRLSRLAIPGMKSRKWGRIVNITSISVKQPIRELVLSNAVRAAVVGLAKTMATDLAPDGILVNNVCPGLHRTSRMEELIGAEAARTGRTVGEIAADRAGTIPVGRMGEPQELASLVVFLASEKASFITGTTIQVDGGQYSGLM